MGFHKGVKRDFEALETAAFAPLYGVSIDALVGLEGGAGSLPGARPVDEAVLGRVRARGAGDTWRKSIF